MSDPFLRGRRARVTGSVQGIGLAMATELARAGASVGLHGLPDAAAHAQACKAVAAVGGAARRSPSTAAGQRSSCRQGDRAGGCGSVPTWRRGGPTILSGAVVLLIREHRTTFPRREIWNLIQGARWGRSVGMRFRAICQEWVRRPRSGPGARAIGLN